MAASPTSMATPQRASAASCFKDAPLTHVFLSALVKGVFQAFKAAHMSPPPGSLPRYVHDAKLGAGLTAIDNQPWTLSSWSFHSRRGGMQGSLKWVIS